MLILDGFGANETDLCHRGEEKKECYGVYGAWRERPGCRWCNSLEALSMAQSDTKGIRNPALIIAFTGRSSIEDQTDAVRVGIDLFMTKPVALKEVGKSGRLRLSANASST